MVNIKMWRNERCRFTVNREKRGKRWREGERRTVGYRLYRIRALSIPVRIGYHMAALWRRLYIGTSSSVRYVTCTYVCCARCIAFPRRRSAISRELPWRSFVAAHRTAARRFKWVAQTAPAWVLCARARQNWFKPHYTWTYTRESRRASSIMYDDTSRASLFLFEIFRSVYEFLLMTLVSILKSIAIYFAIITMADQRDI